MFAQDLVESDEAFDILIDEVLGENDFNETSSLTEPSSDPDVANNMVTTSTKPAKKKRRSTKRTTNNPKFMPAIRIFRRDIRRKYAEMLNNVLNSYDLELHRRFLEEFGNPDLIQIIFQSYPPDLFEKLSYAPRIEGIDSLVESIGRQYLTVPDIAFQLSDVKVCQRLNTPGSKIVATSMIRGTMLYSIVPTTQRYIQDKNQELSYEEEDRSRYEDQVFLEMLDKQLDFCLEGIVTISLDDQHRFISISIEAEKVLSQECC